MSNNVLPEKHAVNKSQICLILIVFLGFSLRAHKIGSESIWYDEAISIKIASSDIVDIFTGESKDLGNPPLYSILLFCWMRIFGNSEIALRSLSALFGVLCLIPLYKLGRLVLTEATALFAALILAVSPLHVYFSQEARAYTLVTFLCLMSVFFFVKYIKQNRLSALIGYIAATSLSMSSHYFAFFVVAAQCVCLIVYRQRHKSSSTKLLIAQVISGLLFLGLCGQVLISQIALRGNLGRYAGTWFKHFLYTPIYYSVGKTLIWKDSPILLIAIVIPVIAIVFGSAFLIGIAGLRKNRELLCLLGLWLILPILIPVGISIFLFPFYSGKYSIMASPAYYLIMGAGISSVKTRKIRYMLVTGIVVLSSVSVINYYSHNFKREWRSAAGYVAENSRNEDIVLFCPDIGEDPFSYYDKSRLRKIRLADRTDLIDTRLWGYLRPRTWKLDFTVEIDRHKRVWLILVDDVPDEVRSFYKNILSKDRELIRTQEYKGIEICLYRKHLISD